MISYDTSGESGIGTSSADWTTLMAASTDLRKSLTIINDGSYAGLFRIGGAGTGCYLPRGVVNIDLSLKPVNCPIVEIKRIGANDLDSCFAFAF